MPQAIKIPSCEQRCARLIGISFICFLKRPASEARRSATRRAAAILSADRGVIETRDYLGTYGFEYN